MAGKINKFKVYNSNGNKKLKIVKNNKLVYAPYTNYNNFLQHNDLTNSTKSYKKHLRSSCYRGVSKNGKKWQVLLMNGQKKYYFGSYSSEELAAKIYDLFSMKFRGDKATTNFNNNE